MFPLSLTQVFLCPSFSFFILSLYTKSSATTSSRDPADMQTKRWLSFAAFKHGTLLQLQGFPQNRKPRGLHQRQMCVLAGWLAVLKKECLRFLTTLF